MWTKTTQANSKRIDREAWKVMDDIEKNVVKLFIYIILGAVIIGVIAGFMRIRLPPGWLDMSAEQVLAWREANPFTMREDIIQNAIIIPILLIYIGLIPIITWKCIVGDDG